MNTENPVHAFGKRTRTQHLANAQVKVLYVFPYLPSKQNLCFFVFFGVGNQGPNVRVKLGGSTVGSLPGDPSGGPRLWGLCAGAKLSRGCLCLKKTESSHTICHPRHTIYHPHATCKFTAFSADYTFKHKMHVAWKG